MFCPSPFQRQINTGHELVLTELVLENFLAQYEPAEVVALLAAFIFQERRSETEPVLTKRLQEVSCVRQSGRIGMGRRHMC